MRRSKPRFLVLGLVLLALNSILAPILADEFKIGDRTFSLPKGYTIERVAGPPLVDRPITADFDEKGRLYVSDSSGSNDNPAKQLIDKPHKIVRLEDTNDDGIFDRRTIFADKMMFPEGTMWYDGSLYVAAPPSIWKLTDTDDDGVADQRFEWFKGKTLTGCANDLHGPYLGPDGWIYWTKGAFAEQTYERPGKPPFVTKAAHIFRARPDGTGLEAVMTGGMDNPVDVVFTTGGERIFTTTFLQTPGNGNRDGLLHAVYGAIYGQVNSRAGDHFRTSPGIMPTLVHLGAAAPSGLVSWESDRFGDNAVGTLFAANFNMRRITRHRLTPKGATFEAVTDEFLTSPDRDFHPTDVLEDADGSMLVIDTGGWYKLCCPTSQIPKPDVLGAIYRVSYAAKPRLARARVGGIDWKTASEETLVARLNSYHPAVEKRAIEALAKRGNFALASLAAAMRRGSAVHKRNAIWTSCRIDDSEARIIAHDGIIDPDPTVRQVAIQAMSLWRDRTAAPVLIRTLANETETAANKRVAAEALGRIGDKSAVPTLLKAAGDAASDPFLWHSCAYALIEIAAQKETSEGLTSDKVGTQRAALVALDQMSGGGLQPDQVVRYLTSSDPEMREAASWIATRHPDWAEALAGHLRYIMSFEASQGMIRAQLIDQLAHFASAASIQTLLSGALRDAKSPAATRIAVRAISRSGLKTVPDSWRDGLVSVLERDDAELAEEAISCIKVLPWPKNAPETIKSILLKWGSNGKNADMLRLNALAAVPGGLIGVKPDLFDFLRSQIDPEQPVDMRMASASVLAKAMLDGDQLLALTDAVKTAGPLEVDRILSAFETSNEDAVGLKLLAALRVSNARSALRPEILKPRLDRFGQQVRSEADAFYATLNVDAPAQKARLESLLPKLAGGDIIRGQTVFNGPKAGCLSCHAVGYLGGRVGPDLSRIAEIRTDRDLLESILYPSLSFVRSFEPMTVATRDGKVVNGVLKGESSEEIVLAINANDQIRIPRSEVEAMRPGTVSVMPAGLDQQLTQQEMADLLAFLRSRK